MRRRDLIIGLAAVFALSSVLPAIGAQPADVAQRALKIAKRADKRSKAALQRSSKQGTPGAPGKDGAPGKEGPPPSWLATIGQGTARAFGLVDRDGAIGSGKQKHVLAITHPATGTYCIELGGEIDSDITEVFATPDLTNDDTTVSPSGTSAKHAFVETVSERPDCGTPNRFEVRTFNQVFENGLLTDIEPADNGFFFVVP